ncbi:MAG: type III-B CRISPR module RAMP protein Cmr4 [Acidobacteriota bacterium]
MTTSSDSRQVTDLLFVHALTGLHPGSGTALGVVDLPVQRERHTQWPTIPGSSLKGILRDACREALLARYGSRKEADADADLTAVFGPPSDSAHEHAGALALTDARLLAFPVRSLRGVFAWTTCKTALDRLNRDLGLTCGGRLDGIPDVAKDSAACAENSPLLVDGKFLVLEEFEFEHTAATGNVGNWIADHATADVATQERIKTHLAILHDDDFTHFVRHATEVVARVGLDYETKTVKSGALFYEEFLPAETIFYSLAIAEDGHSKEKRSAQEIMDWVRKDLPKVLHVGAGQTVGKGLCAVRLDAGKGE